MENNDTVDAANVMRALIGEQTLLDELKDILKDEGLLVSEVDPTRNYWFIRTQGGSYFDEFYFNQFVAIGWDDVPCLPEGERSQQILDQIKESGYVQATRVMNQVYRFCTELKIGDVVVIPSESSVAFAFGYIDSEVYEVVPTQEEIEAGKCQYKRRRKIKWITGVPRNRVDPKLYAFFRNQQALSFANEYAEFIDRAISSFYIKNDVAHLTLSVETEKSPRADDIPTYMHGILARAFDLATEVGLIKDEDDSGKEVVQSRINVQSEGIIELLGNPTFVFFICVVVIALFGGKLSFKYTKETTSADVGTDGLPGLLKVISKIMLAHKNDRFIGDEKMTNIQGRLKVKDPREK